VRALSAALAATFIATAACSSKDDKSSATGGSGNGAGAGGTTATGGSQGGSNTGGGGSSGAPSAGASTGGSGDAGATSGGAAGTSPTGGAGDGQGGAGTSGDGAGGSSGAGAGGSATGGSGGAPTGTLDIYFVDTEGGQATVMKLPGGQVFIVDTGNPGARDGDRIQAVLRDELSKTSVEYLLTTHYDGDHVGGATYLNQRTPVTNFLDHGDQGAPSSYLTMANAGTRRVIEAGDTLDVGGVHFDFVSANGELITTALPGGGANPNCSGVAMKNESDENENSVGFILRFGSFDFIDLGDLLWDWELRLACPTNLLGQVDLYLTTHHGLTRSGAPPLVRAVQPLAAVMNNGPRKGGGGSSWTTLTQAPGAGEVWQLHQALASPASENAPADQIANPGEGSADMAFFLKVTVLASGAFTIENPRTSASRTYQSR
jgi:competence protein ComEC